MRGTCGVNGVGSLPLRSPLLSGLSPKLANPRDHAELPDDFDERAAEIMEAHAASPVPDNKVTEYNARPAKYWDKFYSNHADQFFKNRRWLPLEFPELVSCCEPDAGPKVVLEVGCGAGNTVFPLLMHNENPDLRIFATDYSKTAVKVVQAGEMYPRAAHGLGELSASVWDITSRPSDEARAQGITYALPEGVEAGSVDVLTVVYVLSALHPDEWEQAVHNLYSCLKPGGLLLVRDYGRHDLAQLRIKKERLLDVPNFYIRGDGTRVYFFEKDQMGDMLTAPPRGGAEGSHMFQIHQLAEDRRLVSRERGHGARTWSEDMERTHGATRDVRIGRWRDSRSGCWEMGRKLAAGSDEASQMERRDGKLRGQLSQLVQAR